MHGRRQLLNTQVRALLILISLYCVLINVSKRNTQAHFDKKLSTISLKVLCGRLVRPDRLHGLRVPPVAQQSHDDAVRRIETGSNSKTNNVDSIHVTCHVSRLN